MIRSYRISVRLSIFFSSRGEFRPIFYCCPGGAEGCSHGWSAVAARRTQRNPWRLRHYVSAPAGQRAVATGGAQFAARRTQRNPWRSRRILAVCPCGAEGFRCATFSPFLRPCRGESKIMRNLSHGFRVGGLSPRRRCTRGYIPSPLPGRIGTNRSSPTGFASSGLRLASAAPVATFLRPCRGGIAQCTANAARHVDGLHSLSRIHTSRQTRCREHGACAATQT
jgi:hypothetical protein